MLSRCALPVLGAVLFLSPIASAVPLTPVKAEPVGPGGGGSMFWPAVSPRDPRLMFVSCDMNGFYRSADGGHTWTMLDGRLLRATYNPSSHVWFHPRDPKTLYVCAYAQGQGTLRIS